MQKIGIICNLIWDRCFNLKQYYYTITSLYGEVKLINTCEDLDGIEILFIGDDHHCGHKKVLTQSGFVDKCNADGIKVVVFTSERIFDSFFAWNVDNYNYIKKFKNLYHYTMDVDDCILLGTKLHRNPFSKLFKNFIDVDVNNKVDKAVFIGRTDFNCYEERKIVIDTINKIMPIDIIPSTIGSYKKYLETLSKYRFVFCPIGNGNFLTIRFYECLLVKSIPIYQVRKNTLQYFDIEAKFDDCIFFQNVDEVPDKVQNCALKYSHNEFWAEDYFGKVLKEAGLL